MYSLPASSTYRPIPYSSILPSSLSNVHQYSPADSILTAAVGANPSPLPNLASSFHNKSQVLSHPTFYLSHFPNNSSAILNDPNIASPSDPLYISPDQEPLLDSCSARNTNKVHGPSLFGYVPPPARNSTLSNSMGASSYFTPSFPFSASSNFYTSGNCTTSGNQLASNQFSDTATTSLLSSEAPLSTGLAPYPALPIISDSVHRKSVSSSKLSFNGPSKYKLTPERAAHLIKWFDKHKDHPYPSRPEKIHLCQTTQLTYTQVSTWFANARRRMKKASLEEEAEKSGSTCSSLESSPASSPDEVTRSSIASSAISQNADQ